MPNNVYLRESNLSYPSYYKTMLIIMFYRKMLRSNSSKMFEPLFQQWERDVLKVAQEDENFVVSIRFSVVTNVLRELVRY